MNNTWFKNRQKPKSAMKLLNLSECNAVPLKAKPPVTHIHQPNRTALRPSPQKISIKILPSASNLILQGEGFTFNVITFTENTRPFILSKACQSD